MSEVTGNRGGSAGEGKGPGGWMILIGILTVLFGMFAIGAPFVAGVGATIWIGAAVFVAGVCEIFHAFGGKGWRAGILGFLWGALEVVAGVFVMRHPISGLATLTLILVGYLLLEGVTKIALAFKMRPSRGWGWVLFGGIVTLLLCVMIWRQWPLSGIWAIGTLVGIKLLFDGWALALLGGIARSPRA